MPRNPDVVYTFARLTDMCSRRLESNAVVVLLVKRRIAVRFHISLDWPSSSANSLCVRIARRRSSLDQPGPRLA